MKRAITMRFWCCCLLVLAGSSRGAILSLEEFDAGANGWTDRDIGDMSVSYDGINEWMVGDFGSQMFAIPQTDAFQINSGTDFIGDYVTPGLTQIRFDLFAVNVLPSDLFIRIVDGANIFSYQFNPVTVGNWQTFTVDLAWSFGWSGVSETAFNDALASVDAVEIQITRSGTSAQSYYLDNVETLDVPLEEGGGGMSAVPEPNTISMLALIAVFVLAFKRKAASIA